MQQNIRRTSVLVVEDEWLVSDMISSVLEHEGYNVQVASNAVEALEFLKSENPPDVLFTDINLDGKMDGSELAQCARKIRPHIPVVYASGRPSKFNRETQVPGSKFLPKPYSPLEVCKLVAQAVKLSSSKALRASSRGNVPASECCSCRR